MFGLGKKAKPVASFPRLFNEQEMLIGVLKNDPRIMSHVWGQDVYHLQHVKRNDAQAQHRIDEILQVLCDRFSQDPETISRVIRTMLVTYKIDIDTAKVPCFENVHGIIQGYVCNHFNDIKVYE